MIKPYEFKVSSKRKLDGGSCRVTSHAAALGFGRLATVGDYNTILEIAVQCPYSGGHAVYEARVILELLNESLNNIVEYNDDSVCIQHGIYRQAQYNSSELPLQEILIKPNPANDMTDIVLMGDYTGICKINIENMFGQLVYTHDFNCNEKRNRINTSTFVSGMYIVSVYINNNVLKTNKLIIAR